MKTKFRLDKFSIVAISSLLIYIGTNLETITWTQAGLTTFGTGLLTFLIQALIKSIQSEE
jgi:hypothetical protein